LKKNAKIMQKNSYKEYHAGDYRLNNRNERKKILAIKKNTNRTEFFFKKCIRKEPPSDMEV
jgi:hypothetical protein